MPKKRVIQVDALKTVRKLCVHPDTKLVLYKGGVKRVAELVSGDVLMGLGSIPISVNALIPKKGQLYKVEARRGEPLIVALDHSISLKNPGSSRTYEYPSRKLIEARYYVKGYFTTTSFAYDKKRGRGKAKTKEQALLEAQQFIDTVGDSKHEMFDITLKEYFAYPEDMKSGTSRVKCWHTGCEFRSKELLIDPYFVGLWLGDGTQHLTRICTYDSEIIDWLIAYAERMGLKVTMAGQKTTCDFDITKIEGPKNGDNPLRTALRDYGMLFNKHIPDDYLYTDRESRLKLLAGLIDTDGHFCHENRCLQISQVRFELSDQIACLVRSLGFVTDLSIGKNKLPPLEDGGPVRISEYKRNSIFGDDLHEIPILLPRKKISKRAETTRETGNERIEVTEYKDSDDYIEIYIETLGSHVVPRCLNDQFMVI
jgi:hypothetical protein